MSKALTYVELDLDYCSLRYGTTTGAGTCPAVLGVDSAIKCFNTLSTCAVRPSFLNAPVTLRYTMPADYLPADIEALSDLVSIDYSPAVISLGEDMGMRASLTASFEDHAHSDTGTGGDPYLADRPYDPFKQGTYWGKFRARQSFVRGRALRWKQGTLGQSVDDMDTRHFVMDSFTGPTLDGQFSITAKDVLKLLDGDRSQAPLLSHGQLNADITLAATTAVLTPSGIGNSDYPASGWIAIGGSEIVAFTRSNDTLTITRAQFNTVAVAHNAGDRCQLCLYYHAQDPADVIADLCTTYAGIDSGHIPIAAWEAETAAFYRRVVTALICEPTGCDTLVSELVQQCGLAIWWDDIGEQVRLQVLRAISTTAKAYNDDNVLQATLVPSEQPDKRVSQVWTYFGQFNPLKGLNQIDNFRSTAITVNLEAETDYGAPAIKTIYSRWIPFGGLTVAERINDIQLGRYQTAPRLFTFETARRGGDTPMLGDGARLSGAPMQDATGAREEVPVQVTSVRPRGDAFEVTAEEMLFVDLDDTDLTQHPIIVDANVQNINLRTLHDELYPTAVSGDTVTCTINAGVIVSSASPSIPAFDVGTFATGVIVKLNVLGRIAGAGGPGGVGANSGGSPAATAGTKGGTALKTTIDITMDVSVGDGEIWAGGGGGGGGQPFRATGGPFAGGGGGGGGGNVPASGGNIGTGNTGFSTAGLPGTDIAGGHGGVAYAPGPSAPAGNGGAPGSAGTVGSGGDGTPAAAGASGTAIDGISHITLTGTGDIRGPQIN